MRLRCFIGTTSKIYRIPYSTSKQLYRSCCHIRTLHFSEFIFFFHQIHDVEKTICKLTFADQSIKLKDTEDGQPVVYYLKITTH
jgi:hypothetical protein